MLEATEWQTSFLLHGVVDDDLGEEHRVRNEDVAPDRLLPDFVRAVTAGEAVRIRNPRAIRPWQHVLEPLSGYLLLGARMWDDAHDLDGGWNFGPEPQGAVTVRQVVETLIAAWGSGSWETPAPAGTPATPCRSRPSR